MTLPAFVGPIEVKNGYHVTVLQGGTKLVLKYATELEALDAQKTFIRTGCLRVPTIKLISAIWSLIYRIGSKSR